MIMKPVLSFGAHPEHISTLKYIINIKNTVVLRLITIYLIDKLISYNTLLTNENK